MVKRIFDNSPVEPVHRGAVLLHEDLLSIYQTIREVSQAAIDKAFDQASQEIGYLVTTTVPYTFVIGESGALEGFEIGSEHLKGGVFERVLNEALEPLKGKEFQVKAAGSFSLRLIWLEALKLRLKTHWLEPAHFRREWMEPAHFRREWMEPTHLPTHVAERERPVGIHEPVHWFDPGFAIAGEEKVLISVIDEVYPELKLAERIVDARTHQVAQWPGIREPAHFRPLVRHDYQVARWPGTREPAHQRPWVAPDYQLERWPGTREPAHYRSGMEAEYLARWPGIREPAHYRPWAAPAYELERWPGTREPAHYRSGMEAEYLARWPGIREPAHHRPWAAPAYELERWPGTREPVHNRPAAGLDQAQAVGILQELATVFRKHGL